MWQLLPSRTGIAREMPLLALAKRRTRVALVIAALAVKEGIEAWSPAHPRAAILAALLPASPAWATRCSQ